MKVTSKSVILISATVFSLVAASVIWLVGRREPAAPDLSDKKAEQIAEYLRSDEFRNLGANTRRGTARTAMGQMMAGRAREYFELPPEQWTAYLDKVIDTMRSRRRESGSMRRGFGARGRGPESRRSELEARGEQVRSRSGGRTGRRRARRRGRRRSPERIRARTEFVDPKTRAQMAKFREALRRRMRKRGIDFRRRRGIDFRRRRR